VFHESRQGLGWVAGEHLAQGLRGADGPAIKLHRRIGPWCDRSPAREHSLVNRPAGVSSMRLWNEVGRFVEL
jgi:hypothetical protein